MTQTRAAAAQPSTDDPTLVVFHEHPDWFRPLFDELDRRGVPRRSVHAGDAWFDPATPPSLPEGSVVFNRMSPSAWKRGLGAPIFATSDWLARWEETGIRVINGQAAWRTEVSKVRQLELLRGLGLRAPASRAVHDPTHLPAAARGLRFPVVTKPNVGGSGAGVVRYETREDLASAVREGRVDLGLTGVGFVQEFFSGRDGVIQRVEVLDGRALYGIRVSAPEGEFDLCPADACRTSDGTELTRGACAADAADQGLAVEAFDPAADVVREVEAITRAAGIEVGGVEYVIDAHDGERSYYDVNALSNFVADGPAVVGFDPFERLVDWLERELGRLPAAGAPKPEVVR